MKLNYTRSMVTAALTGELEKVDFQPHPVFQVEIPKTCPEIPSEILDPKNTWKDKDAYDKNANELARRFAENAEGFSEVAPEILSAGPRSEL